MHRSFVGLLCLLLIGSLTGCKEKIDYVAPDSSFGLIYDKIFAPSCALSGCHVAPERKKDLDGEMPFLSGEATYASLINITPSKSQAASAGLKLVIPGNADSSFLYQKVIYDSSAFQFGAKMPSGGLTLSANQIEFMRQWIAAGAPLNGHVADQNLMQ
ncbi:MAG TPA: hypothetical protein VHS96_04830 [Bacteroidia bacterium]|nr:hypothetical protein [Bacteroidia bacterium]